MGVQIGESFANVFIPVCQLEIPLVFRSLLLGNTTSSTNILGHGWLSSWST